MNKQKKDGNISWTDWTWNPLRGLCPVDCKLPDGRSYCYARRMYQRFKWNPEIRFELNDPMVVDRLYRKNIPDGSKVFVCSIFELFHPITNTLLFPLTEGSDITYRDMIFKIIELNPKIIFQILTKMPQNIDRPMPDNVWLGTTITGMDNIINAQNLLHVKAKKYFISFEPFLFNPDKYCIPIIENRFDWIIIGRLTGYGHKHDPPMSMVGQFIKRARKYNIPIFLKNNLKEIWGEKLIQEWPKED